MGKKKKGAAKVIVGVTAAVVVVALIGTAMVLRPKKSNYTQLEAKTGDLSTYYTFSGSVAAKNSETVYAEGMMQIDSIEVAKGDTVKKDDVLLKTTAGKKIKAPIDGTVAEIDVEEDAQVMGGTVLCKIVDYKNLELAVQVDEYDLPAITVGKTATITMNALNKDVSGKVTEIAREGVSQGGVTYFDAKVSLPDESDMRVGMTAQAKVLSKSVQSVTVLPMSAIQFDAANKPFVYKPDEKGRPTAFDVTLGINDGTSVEIKSGVSKGETILVPPTGGTPEGFGAGMRRDQNTGASSAANFSSGGSGK